jgi:subtilisin family serine protease
VAQKPDLTSYTHFKGSGVYPADSGTSAAAPVASGVIAALRSRFPYDVANPSTHPGAMRTHLIDHADRMGLTGHSVDYGWGLIDGCALSAAELPG